MWRGIAAIAGAVLVCAAAAPGAAQAYNCNIPVDRFDRASLGSAWESLAAGMQITDGEALNPNATTALMRHTSQTDNRACADVTAGSAGVSYAAIMLRAASAANGAFVKVQDNDLDGTFDAVWFYPANNTGTFRTAAITTPFRRGRISASYAGATNTLTLDIDTNYDDSPEQTVTFTSVTAGSGQKLALGSFGGGRLERFAVPGTDSTAPALTVTPTAAPGVTGPTTIGGTSFFSGKVVLSTSATDSQSGIAKLACAFDGDTKSSSPSGSPPETFADTFNVTGGGSHTYQCRATDVAGNKSTVASGTFVIDNSPPAASASAAPKQVSNGNITVTLSAVDPTLISPGAALANGSGVASITASVDAGTATTTSGASRQLPAFTTEGTHTVSFFATDRIGNAGAPQTFTVVIDRTAPITAYAGAANVYADGVGEDGFAGTATDNRGVTRVEVRLTPYPFSFFGSPVVLEASCPGCGPTATPVDWSIDLNAAKGRPSSGSYASTIVAFDEAGNVSTATPGPLLTFGGAPSGADD